MHTSKELKNEIRRRAVVKYGQSSKKKGENAMKRLIRNGWFVGLLCVGFFIIGCASYYKVTDPQSGKEYYTKEINSLSGGAVKLKDARSGSTVTLQNSQVKEISENDYKAGLAAPVSKPTPTAAPASAPVAAPVPAAAPAPAPTAAPAAAPAAEPSSAPSGTK
jgi:hypothetical protein